MLSTIGCKHDCLLLRVVQFSIVTGDCICHPTFSNELPHVPLYVVVYKISFNSKCKLAKFNSSLVMSHEHNEDYVCTGEIVHPYYGVTLCFVIGEMDSNVDSLFKLSSVFFPNHNDE